MNAPLANATLAPPPLHGLALAALAEQLPEPSRGRGGSAEADWLYARRVMCGFAPRAALGQWATLTPPADRPLAALAGELGLTMAEVVAVALAVAAENDAMVGRVFAWLQAPVARARPTLGLVARVAESLALEPAIPALVNGMARASGLLLFEGQSQPLPEWTIAVPIALVMALAGEASRWPGVNALGADASRTTASLRAAAALHARALAGAAADAAAARVLVLRSGHPRQAQLAAAQIAASLGRSAMLLDDTPPAGFGPWLWLVGALPVVCAELSPGETRRLAAMPGYRGATLVATGPDGCFEVDGQLVGSWTVPLPTVAERQALWRAQLPSAALADRLGSVWRYDAPQIETLGRAARYQASLAGADEPGAEHVAQAARNGVAGELGPLAVRVTEAVGDDALVAPAALRDALHALYRRCLAREGLAERLGVAARTRYRPGVRGLFVGPSGTGKTLAAGWLATRLGLPLYRVDVAAVSSKYIGETEKNLAQLFARAEHTEAVLLFDEADSLFGKRTEIKESNDRFANAQTNYLLQRIESFDGIALLTSNGRARFDSAFTRRLDAIIDFPPPSPDDRRALWLAHLGAHHALTPGEINRLAAACELAGGHIRNAVLHAAVLAGELADDGGHDIDFADVVAGVAHEYRKLGRLPPPGLLATGPLASAP